MAFEILFNIHLAGNHSLQQLLDARLIIAMKFVNSTQAAHLKHIEYQAVFPSAELRAQNVEIERGKASGDLREGAPGGREGGQVTKTQPMGARSL